MSSDATFSADDRSGWTHVEAMSDDTCSAAIPLGFTFTGWGQAVTSVTLSSNGVLFFGPVCSADFGNSALPTDISPNALLAFFWDDLFDYGAGEYYEYTTTGSPGGRVFHLYFRNRLFSSVCGTDAMTVMISIHEGSNLITATYLGFTGCLNMRGASATIGLQGPNGTDPSMLGFNAPVLDDNAGRQTVSFQPPRQ
jgi:hypothetical protein